MRVYLASPYSAPTHAERLANVERAMAAAIQLIRHGYLPLQPLLTHYFDEWATAQGETIHYETYLDICLAWVDVADALLFLASSPGADRERARAIELGIPVFTSVTDLCNERIPA